LIAKVWAITPTKVWAKFIPWIINNNELHGPRLRSIKSLCWVIFFSRIPWIYFIMKALPERAQQIGAMVRDGVSEDLWNRLVADVPIIIPRNFPGYTRYY
jgi:hypothetical protein